MTASAAAGLATAADLNTRLFRNCLLDVSDADAIRRPSDAVNSIGFIACHVLDARHFLARFLGLQFVNPIESVIGTARGIDDVASLPPLADVRQYWAAVSRDVHACISSLADSELAEISPQRFPVDNPTFGAAIEFQLHHESYHIGQLALLRKYYGYPAMTYR